MFRDITERTVLDEMKRQFVSTVSHELRTPLTAIRGSLEMLADGDTGKLPTQAQDVVDVAARGTERLTRLVNDIIDIERLEAGSFGVRPRPEDVGPLVVDATDSLAALAAERDVDIELGRVGGSALCDADRIVQALVNLVGNAVEVHPPRRHRAGQRRTVADTDILFSVADEGRGIPPEEFDTIFERFHQVHHNDGRARAAPGSACRSPRPSSNGTAAGSGSRASSAPARGSASRCRRSWTPASGTPRPTTTSRGSLLPAEPVARSRT